MSTYDHIKCPICFVPWAEHTPECSRHEYRPGMVAAVASGGDSRPAMFPELPHLLKRLADELERSAASPRPSVPVLWSDLSASGLVSMAAAEIERLHRAGRDADEATQGMASTVVSANDASIELSRLRVAIDRIVAVAVRCTSNDPHAPWEWCIGRICSCTFDDRADAVAAFRGRFGLENGRQVDASGLRKGTLTEAVAAIREAGAKDWDKIGDPASYLGD